ncbi:beta strand repeat-containing protein [Flavobacterium sp. RSB2_4_14]|uniref:beta strand repeat-containing protein n=1 Tax=Flavobacterium sp. RSB2_4_14 TaxID=3447665 RepID=UPI003F2DE5BA
MKLKNYFFFATLLLFGVISKTNGQTDNTFSGIGSGTNNTGDFNTGFGKNALQFNTSNSNNAFGLGTLQFSTGGFNSAFGNEALSNNGIGRLNSAFGTRSLYNNNSGSSNIALGHRTLEANIAGNNNTAIGYAALLTNIGSDNIAIGAITPRHLKSGNSNIFIGTQTAANLLNGNFNVFLGYVALEKLPSTAFKAGNNTDKTIIIADGAGNQRLFIHKNGNTGIGLGNNVIPANKLDIKGGVVIGKNYTPNASTNQASSIIAPTNGLLVEGKVGIGNTSPNNKVEITHGTNGNSGLRFTNLTSEFNPTTANSSNKFLSVNATGDVVLQKMPNAVNSNAITSNANLMTSNVNSIISSANIVNSIANTINANNQLITSVNGVASAPVNLPVPTFTQVPQTITQSGNTITLSNGGGSFTLPIFTDTDVDAQSLTLTGNTLSISNGNSVELPIYTDVPQTISQSENTITLSNGGGSFTLPTFIDTDTDAQSLSLTGNTLSISNGNSVVLPTYTDVPQIITQTGNTITLSNGGGSFTLPSTSVVAGTNVTVTGTGVTASPFVVSANDTSLYANNGVINQATTTSGNRVVDMNNSNIWFNTANSTSNGKIYLGSSSAYPSTTGNYKLFVEGGILTEKVKVALRSSANWADYVFANDYKLMPLKDVEQYVIANKHLPGIDSAEVLAKNGIDVAEMQSKQMEKIEELTLYIIDQNKKIEKQNNEIEELKIQMKALIEKTK